MCVTVPTSIGDTKQPWPAGYRLEGCRTDYLPVPTMSDVCDCIEATEMVIE